MKEIQTENWHYDHNTRSGKSRNEGLISPNNSFISVCNNSTTSD